MDRRLTLAILLLIQAPLAFATGELAWVKRAPLGMPEQPLKDIAYGQGRFVGVDSLASLWTSNTGLVWSFNKEVRGDAVRFQNGRFFVSDWTSADALVWEKIRILAGGSRNFDARTATWMGDRFFAAAYDFELKHSVFGTSNDGIEWRTASGPARFEPRTIATDGAIIVVQGDDFSKLGSGAPAAVVVSADGTWSLQAMGVQGFQFRDVAFGNGRFVAVGGGREISSTGLVLASADGRSWQTVGSAPQTLRHVVFSGGQFVAVGDDATILTSVDGASWTRQISGLEFGASGGTALTALCAYPRGYLVGGDDAVLLRSGNGREWERLDAGPGGVTKGHYFRGEFWFSVQGDFLKSIDGAVWRREPVADLRAQGDFVSGIAYSGEAFVAIRHYGQGFLRSTDGRNWSVTLPDARNYAAIAAAGALIVAVGDPGIATSRDHGLTWSVQAVNRDSSLTGVTYGNGRFVILSATDTLVSQDGTTWTRSPAPPAGVSPVRFPGQAVFFSGRFFGFGGAGGLMESAGGLTWTPVSLPRDRGWLTVYGPTVGDGELHLVAQLAASDVLLSSSDGRIWRDSPLPFRVVQPSLTYGGGIYLLADYYLGASSLQAGTATPSSSLANISALGSVATGPLTLGFAAGGDAEQRLLIRGIGPGLARFGVTNPAGALSLQLFDQAGRALDAGSSVLLPWDTMETTADLAARVGAFPATVGDIFRAVRMRPGTFTVQIGAETAARGTALAEIYDADRGGTNPAGLINLSSRVRLQPGSEFTVGFVIGGARALTVLARVAGPALRSFGVPTAAADPEMFLHRADGTQVAANDDWSRSEQVAAIRVRGLLAGAFAFEEQALDAAVLVTLPPGAYTLRTRERSGAGGEILTELYAIP